VGTPIENASCEGTDPLWFRLLLEQRKKATGLTIPFLVGATRPSAHAPLMDDDAAFRCLACLLTEMRDSTPNPYRVRISRCTTLHEPIAAVYGDTEQMVADEAIARPAGGRPALHVEDRYCPNRERGLDSVLSYFWEECRQALIHGGYSFNDNAYGPFTSGELDLIASAKR
jgi:hypothetical protein